MRYKTRAEELAGRVGESQRLQLVSQLDGQERAEWSARYGASTDSLGFDCADADAVLKYGRWITEQSLQPVTADSSASRPSIRQVALAASGARIVRAMPVKFPQEVVIAGIAALCPGVTWDGFRWPMLEDLLNHEIALTYLKGFQDSEEWTGLPSFPALPSLAERTSVLRAAGDQAFGAASKRALPPLIPFGVGADAHFEQALHCQQVGSPCEQPPVVDADLKFAAEMCRPLLTLT
eukprot:s61_g45.t1